jgi:hypothetical protein
VLGAYLFNPENAVPIDSWFDDPNDTELLDLAPFLEGVMRARHVLLVAVTANNTQTLQKLKTCRRC